MSKWQNYHFHRWWYGSACVLTDRQRFTSYVLRLVLSNCIKNHNKIEHPLFQSLKKCAVKTKHVNLMRLLHFDILRFLFDLMIWTICCRFMYQVYIWCVKGLFRSNQDLARHFAIRALWNLHIFGTLNILRIRHSAPKRNDVSSN